MTFETIRFEHAGGVHRITLNRPERLNAFTEQMHAELHQALAHVEMDETARVLLLTGEGRAFCVGQDLAERNADAPGFDLGRGPEELYNPLARRIVGFRIPIVCAVNGVAAGAGVNVALACDIVVATQSAKFVQAFSAIGMVPDGGGTWLLPRLMGQARAMGFTLLGETLSADQAADFGIIWKAFADDAFADEVDRIVAKLATAPTFGLASAKQALRSSWSRSFEDALDVERDLQREIGKAPDYREGVAAFKEKRKPNFTGRRS